MVSLSASSVYVASLNILRIHCTFIQVALCKTHIRNWQACISPWWGCAECSYPSEAFKHLGTPHAHLGSSTVAWGRHPPAPGRDALQAPECSIWLSVTRALEALSLLQSCRRILFLLERVGIGPEDWTDGWKAWVSGLFWNCYFVNTIPYFNPQEESDMFRDAPHPPWVSQGPWDPDICGCQSLLLCVGNKKKCWFLSLPEMPDENIR